MDGDSQFDTFDEFHAIQLRKRNKTTLPAPKLSSSTPSTTSQSNENTNPNTMPTKVNRDATSWGSFVESKEIQYLIVVFLILDSYTSFGYLILQSLHYTNKEALLASKLLQVISAFSTGIFLLDCFFLLLTFQLRYFYHVGYVVDTIILSVQTNCLLNSYGAESKALNVLRYWRLARLFFSSVQDERAMHTLAIEQVEIIKTQSKQSSLEVARLGIELDREKDGRKALEEMLQTYKDDVEMLNEALKIAAQDIAEAAQDVDYSSGEDEEGDNEDDSAVNKYEVPRTTAFQINEDGSFQPK